MLWLVSMAVLAINFLIITIQFEWEMIWILIIFRKKYVGVVGYHDIATFSLDFGMDNGSSHNSIDSTR